MLRPSGPGQAAPVAHGGRRGDPRGRGGPAGGRIMTRRLAALAAVLGLVAGAAGRAEAGLTIVFDNTGVASNGANLVGTQGPLADSFSTASGTAQVLLTEVKLVLS